MSLRDRLLEAARAELARVGPAALSMRAIARELDVTVGALYRHVDGRDALLTELITEAYAALGEAAERGGVGTPRERWRGAWRGVADWARAHPHEFDLLYGTPVIGYAAPASTIAEAARLPRILFGCLEGRSPGGECAGAAVPPLASMPAPLRADLDGVVAWASATAGFRPTPEQALAVVRAWTELLGTLGFAAHGHYVGSLEHHSAYFDWLVEAHAAALGLE